MFKEFQNHSPAPLRIGMLGLGTVGAGTYNVLKRNQESIVARTGRRIEIVAVAVRNLERAASIVGNDVQLTQDPFAVVNRSDIDVVVEVMGGTTLARELVLQAIANGKHVVTANKALLAEHGASIFAAARAKGVIVAYEAAVAVSIPIIKALREGLVANRIEWVAGIVNGTSNFILSEMRGRGISFADALQDAQQRGYAEADPRLDVDGIDAAHKISLLAANAFGCNIPFAEVHAQGIADVENQDMTYAEHLGYRIKLLAMARRNAAGVEVRVHPVLLPADHLMAAVNGSMNAVMVKGDAAGITMYYGAGAGSEQTASAVIADLVDVARTASCAPAQRVPYLAYQEQAMVNLPLLPIDQVQSRYYLRFGMGAEKEAERALLQTLADAGVQCLSHHPFPQANGAVHLVVLTQTTPSAVLRQALDHVAKIPGVQHGIKILRMESLD